MTDLRERAPETPVRDRPRPGLGWWLKTAGLALLDAVVVWATIVLAADGAWLFFAALLIGAGFVNWVYFWPGTRALRWITPGLVLMTAFLIVPIIYTFYISFTNWATGNLLQSRRRSRSSKAGPSLTRTRPVSCSTSTSTRTATSCGYCWSAVRES